MKRLRNVIILLVLVVGSLFVVYHRPDDISEQDIREFCEDMVKGEDEPLTYLGWFRDGFNPTGGFTCQFLVSENSRTHRTSTWKALRGWKSANSLSAQPVYDAPVLAFLADWWAILLALTAIGWFLLSRRGRLRTSTV